MHTEDNVLWMRDPRVVAESVRAATRFHDVLAGLDVVYSGEPLLPSPELARWMKSREKETAQWSERNPASRE